MSILKKIFLREARFPDEKFWNKDGSSIEPKVLKKPPNNSSYTTSKDLGVGKLSEEDMQRIVQELMWSRDDDWPPDENAKTEEIAKAAGIEKREAIKISYAWWLKNKSTVK